MFNLEIHSDEIKKFIQKRNFTICIVGLGKMGLPLAMVFTNAGYHVSGLDISEKLVTALNSGITDINEPNVAERLGKAIKEKLFIATIDTKMAVATAKFIIFIIPVLTSSDGHADISILEETYERISNFAPNGAIYIQESTLPPGITSGPIKSLLEQNGKKSGRDFGLVFAPERTFSGRAIKDIEENYPKILGGDTDNAAIQAQALYEIVCKKGVIKLSSATAAEAVKTFKGAYRDMNIAIANEFALLADLHKVDVLEIIDAANSEPFSHIHKPGIGVGGHCIPIYPRFLHSQSLDFGQESKLIRQSRVLNDYMVDYAVKVLDNYIEWNDDILVLGLAYRGGVKEHRNSPTLRLIPQLRMKGVKVNLMDPLYSAEEIDALFGENTGKNWNIRKVSDYKIIIICTDHEDFNELNSSLIDMEQKIIYDGRYVLQQLEKHIILQPGRLANNKTSRVES